MEVRCPGCDTAIVLPRRGHGRPVAGAALRIPRDRPDALGIACPACGAAWILDNVVVVLYVARPRPARPAPVVP